MSDGAPRRPASFPLADLLRGARATQLLLVACAAVFAAMVATGCASCLSTLDRFGALLAFDGRVDGWWRMLSSAFVHFSVGHLLMNLFGIAVFGSQMERRHGPVGVLALFAAAAVTGSIFTVRFTDGAVVAAGASGGVFGFMGAWLAFLAFQPRPGRAGQVVPMAVFIAIALGSGASDPRIGNLAHAGGALGGFALAAAFELAHRRSRGRASDEPPQAPPPGARGEGDPRRHVD